MSKFLYQQKQCFYIPDNSECESELHKRLFACHVFLAENLDQTELLEHLLSEGVITSADAECIRAEKGTFKQNCCLLDLLQTKSLKQIGRFIDCLVTSRQIHLAHMIDPNGKV